MGPYRKSVAMTAPAVCADGGVCEPTKEKTRSTVATRAQPATVLETAVKHAPCAAAYGGYSFRAHSPPYARIQRSVSGTQPPPQP